MDRSLLLARCMTKIAGSALATLLVWTFAPVAIGWSPVVITSGSMQPGVRPGDIVVIEPVDATATPLDVGDVLTYRQPGVGRRVTHRVESVNDDGTYTTKGDANQRPDSDPLPSDHVEGKARLLVPYAGLAATSLGARVVASVGVLAFAFRRVRPRRRSSDPVSSASPAPAPTPTPAAAPVAVASTPVAVAPAAPASGPVVAPVPRPLAPAATVPVAWAARPVKGGRPSHSAPAHSTPPGPQVWTAGVRERCTVARRRRVTGAGAAMVLAAVVVPVVAVAAFTGGIDSAAAFSADAVQPPSDLTATAGCDGSSAQVTVGWTASTTVPVDGYDVLRSDAGSAYQHIATLGPSDTSLVDGPVTEGEYAYVARTRSGTWTSGDAAAVTTTVTACP